jgi:3-phosphoshikimate 1-carboxyvinyltransferase
MIRLSHPTSVVKGDVKLPSSKSISNRLLMLQKLYEPGVFLDNLSEANDTQLLVRILSQESRVLDVEDAGTSFRFLLAYTAVTPGEWIIRGKERLHQRPIAELVDALRIFGAEIEYLENDGYAPLKVNGRKLIAKSTLIDVTAVRSSQFISALLLIAPLIEGDFNLKVNTKMSSYSYVQLTISCLRRMGFTVFIKGQYLSVNKQQKFDGEYFQIEPDWTSFYYWLSIAHLAKEVDLFFPGLRLDNMSRERTKLYDVGNKAMFFEEKNGGIRITKNEEGSIEVVTDLNYAQFPDSAMTFAMLIPAVGKKNVNLRGLDSLKYKECNREDALMRHLAKMGVKFTKEEEVWKLDATEFDLRPDTYFETYGDHRMAMCVAPLAVLQPILIEDKEVVKKSYPHFWQDLKRVGFIVEEEAKVLD